MISVPHIIEMSCRITQWIGRGKLLSNLEEKLLVQFFFFSNVTKLQM